MLRIPDVLTWFALAILVAACGSDGRTGPNPLEQDFSANVSDPAPLTTGVGAASNAPESVAYVSLAPGTVPDAASASITNLRSGSEVIVPIVAGGFDPVAVPAEAGDILEITVVTGSVTLKTAIPVPIRRRPIVVRTDPPPQKLDVPLNAIIAVVFSEPIDPASLSGSSIQLHSGSLTVSGTLGPASGKPSTVLFTPAAPLDPGTVYVLSVTQAITDLTGDPLESPVDITFTTSAPDASLAFVWGMAVDESGVCIDEATATVVGGQGLGQRIEQSTPCDAWASDGGFVFKNLTPGEAMTLRATAVGYVTKDTTVVPSSGPQTALVIPMVRLP